MSTLRSEDLEGLRDGQALGAQGASSFAKSTVAQAEIKPQSEKAVYQIMNICQAANKWFGFRELERKKFSRDLRFFKNL